MFRFQEKKSFFEEKECRNQCEFSSMINWQSGCSRHPLVLQMPHFIWRNLVQHFALHFLFFSWCCPSGKHQMDIFKLQKKKDLNMSKEISKLSTFQDTRLFLVFLNVHPQYICLPPTTLLQQYPWERADGEGQKNNQYSRCLGAARKNSIFSALPTTWGNQPLPIVSKNRSWLPLIHHIHGLHVCIVFNMRNSSGEQNSHYCGHRAAKCHW